ncbi:MAG: EAL domain-containing protein, partial [Hyphomicrobiaceae bacterium]
MLGAPSAPERPRATEPSAASTESPAASAAVTGLTLPPDTFEGRPGIRPDDAAWPQSVPKTPTVPLDLDTMQNLIEQLTEQLAQPRPVEAEEPGHGVRSGASGEATATGPAAGGPASAAPSSPPAPAVASAPPLRAVAAAPVAPPAPPVAHIALIADALEANRMDVSLDPILGLGDRKARHFELSVRLVTAHGLELGEKEYGPVAAGSGLLGRIDAQKLSRAAQVLERLRSRGSRAALFSSVAGESLTDDNFAATFTDILATEEGGAERLVLTFTQAEARHFTAAHWRTVADMAAVGLRFALSDVTDLDMDFALLGRHGFIFVKLDANVFLEGLPTPSGRIPASDICRHLAGLRLGVIVDGIAAERDLARVMGFGVLLGQGTLFGGPRSVELDR